MVFSFAGVIGRRARKVAWHRLGRCGIVARGLGLAACGGHGGRRRHRERRWSRRRSARPGGCLRSPPTSLPRHGPRRASGAATTARRPRHGRRFRVRDAGGAAAAARRRPAERAALANIGVDFGGGLAVFSRRLHADVRRASRGTRDVRELPRRRAAEGPCDRSASLSMASSCTARGSAAT